MSPYFDFVTTNFDNVLNGKTRTKIRMRQSVNYHSSVNSTYIIGPNNLLFIVSLP